MDLAEGSEGCGGRYPTGKQGLDALVHDPGRAHWQGPYLRDARMPRDAWGNEFRYRLLIDGTYDLRSSGPDEVFDTADDINR